MRYLSVPLSLAVALAAPALSNDVRILLRSGDVLPSGDSVTVLTQCQIADTGRWVARVALNNDPSHSAVVIDGNLALETGGVAPDGSTVTAVDRVRMSADGTVAVLYRVEDATNPTNEISRIQIGSATVLEEGDFSFIPSAPGTIQSITGFDFDAPSLTVFLGVTLASGANQQLTFTGRWDGTTLVPLTSILGGSPIPAATPGTIYATGAGDVFTLPTGAASHRCTLLGPSGLVQAVLASGSLLIEGGAAGPVPSSTWSLDLPARARNNAAGNTLSTGQFTLSSGQDRGVVVLDGTPIAVEGGGLNGVPGATVGDFPSASVGLATDGTPIFTVPVNSSGAEVLMAGQEVLLRAGSNGTPVEGTTISSLFGAATVNQEFDMTADGWNIVHRAILGTGEVAFVLIERNVGEAVDCLANPNSTGVPGTIRAEGSRFLSINDLQVVAEDLPLNSFGYLGTSRSTSFAPMPGGSSGNLCIGPTVGRYVDQVSSSGAGGTIATNIDLLAIPQPTGFEAAIPGETWYFQLWHRDANGGVATSNFTETVSVTVR